MPTRPAPALAARSGYRWVVLGTATAAQAGAAFGIQGLGVLTGYLQRAFGLSATGVGLAVTMAGAAPIVTLLLVGHLLDRHDERAIVGAGAVIAAGGLVAAAMAGGYLGVLLGLLVFGVGYSTAQPGGSKSVAVWFASRRRGVAMGIRQAGLPLGGAAAALVLPAVAQATGWRAAFAVSAGVALASGALFIALYRHPRAADAPHPPEASRLAPRPAEPRPAERLWPRLADQLRAPAMASILITGVALVTAQYGVTTHFIGFLRDHGGLPLERAAQVFFVVQVAGVLGRIALAAASDRPGRGRLAWVVLCMLATAAMLAVLPVLPTRGPIVAAVAVCLGFFGYGWYGPWVAHVSESAAPGQVGLALGAAMAINQIAIVAAPSLLGLVSDLFGYGAMWWIVAACLAPLALVARRGAPHGDAGRS